MKYIQEEKEEKVKWWVGPLITMAVLSLILGVGYLSTGLVESICEYVKVSMD